MVFIQEKNSGGFIGSAKAVTLKNCTAQNVKVFGRFDTGGLLGYAEGCIITGKASEGDTTKSIVTIYSITQQMRKATASGASGLITYDNRMTQNGKTVRSDDSTYMGGIVGCGNLRTR